VVAHDNGEKFPCPARQFGQVRLRLITPRPGEAPNLVKCARRDRKHEHAMAMASEQNHSSGARISVHGDEMAHDAMIRKDEEAEGCGSLLLLTRGGYVIS
jgi:hypothetical protein